MKPIVAAPAGGVQGRVEIRRFLSLIALFAFVAMPFGHMQASAERATASHCHHGPAAPGKTGRAAADCAIACAIAAAAVAPASPSAPHRLAVAAAGPVRPRLPYFPGIDPGADPPPPRLA